MRPPRRSLTHRDALLLFFLRVAFHQLFSHALTGPQKAPAFLSTEGEEITADETAPAVAFVFKSQVEQHIGEITYFRVIRGRIAEGAELVNTRTGNKEKLSQLFAVAGKNRIKVTELMAGDIGCTVKLKGTRTNDTLSAPSAPPSRRRMPRTKTSKIFS